jgi:hypothetical protein
LAVPWYFSPEKSGCSAELADEYDIFQVFWRGELRAIRQSDFEG